MELLDLLTWMRLNFDSVDDWVRRPRFAGMVTQSQVQLIQICNIGSRFSGLPTRPDATRPDHREGDRAEWLGQGERNGRPHKAGTTGQGRTSGA